MRSPPAPPAWLSINPTTGVLSGTARSGTSSFSYSVTAKNTISSVTAGPFRVTVKSRTVAPSFTAAAPPLIATAGSTYSYTFQASGTPIPTYSLAGRADLAQDQPHHRRTQRNRTQLEDDVHLLGEGDELGQFSDRGAIQGERRHADETG